MMRTTNIAWALTFVAAVACQRAAEEPTSAPRDQRPVPMVIPAATPLSTLRLFGEPVVAPPPTTTATATAMPTCPPDPEKGGPKIPTYTLTVTEPKVSLEAEFVSTPRDSERGLMYRTSMPVNHGMLFKLPKKDQTFWMHNTCIPLDMLFVEADGKIVGILENVPILNDEPRSVGIESVYVLEMNAGWSKAHGVRAGQRIALPDPVKKLVVK